MAAAAISRAQQGEGKTKIFVLNDPTAGLMAETIKERNPALQVTCIYDKDMVFLSEVARVALDSQSKVSVKQHESATGRTRGASARVSLSPDESMLLLVPQWLDPDFRPTGAFAGIDTVPTFAASTTRAPSKRMLVTFDGSLARQIEGAHQPPEPAR